MILDDQFENRQASFDVTQNAHHALKGSRGWMLFSAIAGLVILFFALLWVLMLIRGRGRFFLSSLDTANALAFTIVSLSAIGFYTYRVVVLLQYAHQIKVFNLSGKGRDFSFLMSLHNRYWRLAGIMSMVAACVGGLIILIFTLRDLSREHITSFF